jgi:hypothetical protein
MNTKEIPEELLTRLGHFMNESSRANENDDAASYHVYARRYNKLVERLNREYGI